MTNEIFSVINKIAGTRTTRTRACTLKTILKQSFSIKNIYKSLKKPKFCILYFYENFDYISLEDDRLTGDPKIISWTPNAVEIWPKLVWIILNLEKHIKKSSALHFLKPWRVNMHKLIKKLILVGRKFVLSSSEFNLDLHIPLKKKRLKTIFFFFSRMKWRVLSLILVPV